MYELSAELWTFLKLQKRKSDHNYIFPRLKLFVAIYLQGIFIPPALGKFLPRRPIRPVSTGILKKPSRPQTGVMHT